MAANVNAQAFIPEIWDASILRTLEDNLVLKKICNMKPSKDIAGAGDTVYFNGLADPSVSAYTGSLDHEALVDDQIALLIDKQAKYAFKVTDVEQAMANVDLKGSQAQRAAYQLKDYIEKDVFQNTYLEAAAGTVTDTTCDSATILGDVTQAQVYLAENNVTEDNMWMLVSPAIMAKMKLAGIVFSINEGVNGKGVVAYTKDLGFDIYVSNTVYKNGGVHYCMAGSYQSIGFAEKMLGVRHLQAENSRAMLVDDVALYGYKVIKPQELVRMDLTPVAETAI